MERINPDPNTTNEPPPTSAPLNLNLQDEIAGYTETEMIYPDHNPTNEQPPTSAPLDLTLQLFPRVDLKKEMERIDPDPDTTNEPPPTSAPLDLTLQLWPQVDRNSGHGAAASSSQFNYQRTERMYPDHHSNKRSRSTADQIRLPCAQRPLSSGFGSAGEPVIAPRHHDVVPQTTYVFGDLLRPPPSSVPRDPRVFPSAHYSPVQTDRNMAMPSLLEQRQPPYAPTQARGQGLAGSKRAAEAAGLMGSTSVIPLHGISSNRPPRPPPNYCILCTFDLAIEPLGRNLPSHYLPGILQFPCGHGYHMSCLRPSVPLPFHCCQHFAKNPQFN